MEPPLILPGKLCFILLKNENSVLMAWCFFCFIDKQDRMFLVRMTLDCLIKLFSFWYTVGTFVYLLLMEVECNLLLKPYYMWVRLKRNDITFLPWTVQECLLHFRVCREIEMNEMERRDFELFCTYVVL